MGSPHAIVADIIDFRLADDAQDAPVLVVRAPARPAIAAAALASRDVLGDAGVFRLETLGGMLQWRAEAAL